MQLKALINQPCSWDEFIFCQGIVNNYIKRGYEVTWPVIPLYLDELKRHYPKVNWVNQSSSPLSLRLKVHGNRDGYEFLPLRYASEILGAPDYFKMKSKYDLLSLNWKAWKNHGMWERDLGKESELMGEVDAYGEYALVNKNYRRIGKRKNQRFPTDLRVIEMDYYEGYSMLDWGMVIQNATEIYTVVTSNVYMMELLPLKAKQIHLYNRKEDSNLKSVSYLLEKAYVFHE